VLNQQTYGGHHGHTTVLDLGGAQLPEASLIANLSEAQRVEEAQRRNGTNLT